MLAKELWQLEAHGSGATLYVSGVVCADAMDCALEHCNRLAPSVGALRVDLTGAESVSVEALRLVKTRLANWQRARDGIARIERAKSLRSHERFTERQLPIVTPARQFALGMHATVAGQSHGAIARP